MEDRENGNRGKLGRFLVHEFQFCGHHPPGDGRFKLIQCVRFREATLTCGRIGQSSVRQGE